MIWRCIYVCMTSIHRCIHISVGIKMMVQTIISPNATLPSPPSRSRRWARSTQPTLALRVTLIPAPRYPLRHRLLPAVSHISSLLVSL